MNLTRMATLWKCLAAHGLLAAMQGIEWALSFFTAILFAALVIWFALPSAPTLMDNTDNPDTGTLSGMSLKIDYGTGCHYLARLFFITPRLDANGSHICTGAPS